MISFWSIVKSKFLRANTLPYIFTKFLVSRAYIVGSANALIRLGKIMLNAEIRIMVQARPQVSLSAKSKNQIAHYQTAGWACARKYEEVDTQNRRSYIILFNLEVEYMHKV
jgi:hypothetical protein